MRFGLDVAQQRMPWDELVRRVRLAEDLGFDGVWGFDHFQPMYGDGPGETFEGMTTLAALSGVTSRIRLGLLVTGVTYRHPSVLAAQAVTIDHASHGRLELALGAAWFEKEHLELGIPFPPTAERFDLLEDTLEIVTRLFSGDVVSYEGKRVSLHEARMLRRARCSSPTPRSGSEVPGPGARSRWRPASPTSGTPSVRRTRCAKPAPASTVWPRKRAAIPSSILRAGSLSLDDLETARRHAAKWRDAGYGYLVCGWPGRRRVAGRGVRPRRPPGVRLGLSGPIQDLCLTPAPRKERRNPF